MPAKPKNESKNVPKTTGTDLFLLCPSATWEERGHKVLVEVTHCRNGTHRLHCKGCGATLFMQVGDERWRKKALTLAQARATVGWDMIWPARGPFVLP